VDSLSRSITIPRRASLSKGLTHSSHGHLLVFIAIAIDANARNCLARPLLGDVAP
jgi:hypothetical protein